MNEGISYIVGAQESVQNASKVGNAFKTISANLAGIKTSAKTGETSLNKTAVALEKLGIKVKDDKGNIRGMNEILNDLGSKWKDLNKTQKSGIAEAIAGKNHINTLQALMNNWDTVLQYQKEYNAGMMVGSAEKENERYINSIEGKMTLLKENITQLVTTVMSTDMFKNLLDGANSFLETVNKIMKSLNEIPGLLQATVGGGAIALYQGLQQKGAGENVTGYWTKMANWYKQAAQNGEQLNTANTRVTTSMGSVNAAIQRYNTNAGRTTSTTAQASQMLQRMGASAGTINTNVSNASQGLSVFNQNANNTGNVLNQSERQISVFTQGMQNASENANEAGQNINTTGQAAGNATSRLGGMKNVLTTVGQGALGAAKGFLTMVGNMALLSAGVFVIEQVASAIYKVANANKLAYQSAQDRISETESTVAGYRQQISSLSSISERYDELNKKTSKTKDEESELLSLRQQIAEISPDLVIGWDDENQPLLALNGSLKDYIENLKEVQKIERTKKASQENTAGRLALNEIKKANETNHDRLQPGFDFTNESQIMQTKYFGAQIKSLQQYSENYSRILEERNKQVSKKNEDLAENYDKMSEYIQSAQTLALNRLNDSGIYKNWSEMSDKISGSMYTLFNEFDWSSKYVDTQSEQNKFLEGFNKIAEYAEKNKGKVEDWTKSINAAQQAYQLTGDADAFADSIGGIAEQLHKVTGIDASQWVETLRGTLEGALDEEQMRLADFLKNNGSSLTDYLKGDEKAVELHAKWVADNTLADLLNDQDVTDDEKKVKIRAYAEGSLEYEGSSEVQRIMKAVFDNDKKIDDVELGIVTKITSSEARGGGLSGKDADLLSKILKGEAVDADIKTDIIMSDGTIIAREELQKMNEEAKEHPIELQTKLNKEETEKAIKEVTDDKNHREILMNIKTEFRDKDQVQDFDNLITGLQGDKSNIEAVISANIEGLSECETYEEMINWLIDHKAITTECGVTILGKDDVTSLTESLKELKIDDNIKTKIIADVQRGDLSALQKDIHEIPEEKRMKVVAAIQEALGNLDTVEGKTLHDKTLQVTQNGAGEVIFKLAEVDDKTKNKTKHVDVNESGADETKQKMQDIQDQPSTKNVVVNFIQSGWDYIQGLFSKLSSGLQSTIEDGIPMFDGISVNPFDTESPISDHIFKATALDMPDTSAIDSFTADATSGISKGISSFSSFKTKDIPINVALYGVSSIKNGIELMTTLNNQLSKVEHNVSLANAKLDNLFGKKRISTLQSMNKSLQEQQRLLKQQYTYQTKEASKLQKVLSNTYGFKFNDDGNVTNYLKKLTQMETKLKQLEKTSEKASKSTSKTTKSSSTKDTSKMTKSQKAAYKKQQEAIKKQAQADKAAKKSAADTAKNNYDSYKDSYEQAKTYLEKYMKLQFDDIGSTKEEFEKLKTQIRENNDEIEKLKFEDKIYKYVNAVEMLNSKFETLGDILDGLDTKLDMSHGQKSLDIMNKQLKYMAEQKKYLESSLSKETKESKEYSKKLKDYGFKFDKLGNISNEDSVLNKHQNSADLDKIKEYVDGYKDVHNNLQKTKNDILDIEKSMKDTNESLSLAKLEQSTYKTKNAITSTDKSINKLEDDLDTLDTKLNYAYGTDRLDLLNKKQETYNKLIGETNKNLSNYKKEQSAYQKELEKYGFKFDKDGQMTNLADAMNKLQNSGSYEYVSDLIDTWNDLSDSISDSKKSIDDYNDSIKKANEDRLNTTKDMEDKITSMYQDQLDKRKDQLQKQADKEVDIINKVKDAYNDKKDEDKYNEQFKEQQDKIAKLNQDIELAKRDTSLSGRAKLESLMEELADENKNLQDLVKDREDELMDKMFDNAIDNVNNSNDKALEELEKTWDDSKIAEMVKNALGSGVFEDIDGNLINLQDAMIKFAEESGEAFGVMGESIKNDYIANLQIAYDTIKNIDSIYSNLGLKPNDDIQAGIANDNLAKTINVGGIEIEISGAGANAMDIANEVKAQIEGYMSNIINRV